MKTQLYIKLVLVFVIYFACIEVTLADWRLINPIPTSAMLNDVVLVGENTGYTVGNNGNILKTIDGGYIVAGYSYSTDGDVTGHHGTSSNRDWQLLLKKIPMLQII